MHRRGAGGGPFRPRRCGGTEGGRREAGEKGYGQEGKEAGKQYSLTEVRAILAEKSRAGFTAEVRELLAKHGADKLSGIDPSEYASLVADVEVL